MLGRIQRTMEDINQKRIKTDKIQYFEKTGEIDEYMLKCMSTICIKLLSCGLNYSIILI